MNTRNSKKRAIEKMGTVATTKRTRNNQEEQASLDDLDDLLINNNNIPQSISTKKTNNRGRKKKTQEVEALDTHENNTNNQQCNTSTQGTNKSHKGDRGKKVVTPQPQIIDALLNDSDSLNEDDNEINNDISNDGDKAHETITPTRPIPTIEKEANHQNGKEIEMNRRTMSVLEESILRPATLDSRANNQNEFLPSNPNLIMESRTGSQVDFTSPRKILSRPNSALLGINSQDDEHFSSLRMTLGSNSNSRTPIDVNNQNDDYSIPSGTNSRFQSCINSQDDDYYIPLRRTNIPNHYPLSRTLYSKPTRPSPLGSSANVLNIHNNAFNNNTTHTTHIINEEIPDPFNEMTIYQLCSWLFIEGSRFMSSNSNGSSIPTSSQENKTKACRDFLEELKCLFLRVRNPPKSAFEELIRQVLKCELNSAEGIEWLHTANRHFGDFRNKLVNSVEKLIENFKEKRNLPMMSSLQKDELISFVDESVTAHVLSRWLNATNLDELQAQGSMSRLCKFIQHAFAVNYSARDTEKTKTLDKLTKDIGVPSRNGKNFASNLHL
ncbi:hypothetical protein RhiirA5_410833 [Rhizophagus irregularis]|uniref:Uncharacterized protein n=1 Tax=Rhizophagus irregularis TaxID=588596 RepID=A0A2N0Q2C1_9GLOM|nr:hypothetical protein RhiirA5_410833 [Rhizophagus irregularis]